MLNNNHFEIDMKNGYKIVADKIVRTESENDEEIVEIYIFMIDENSNVVQDIAMFRNDQSVDNILQLFVWEDKFNEDYTKSFNIPMMTKEEWESVK